MGERPRIARIRFRLSGERAEHPGVWDRLHCHWTSDPTPDGAAFWVPEISSTPRAEPAFNLTQFRGVWDLLRSPSFRWLIVVASLILGSHAMHDSFAMIGWNAAGISPVVGSALWSESVAAEVIVFVVLGPFLLRHLTPESAMPAIGKI